MLERTEAGTMGRVWMQNRVDFEGVSVEKDGILGKFLMLGEDFVKVLADQMQISD